MAPPTPPPLPRPEPVRTVREQGATGCVERVERGMESPRPGVQLLGQRENVRVLVPKGRILK